MSYKISPISLDGACTVIHDNTLYAFSANGFVKLPLKSGAEWTRLASGEAVTGGTCVGSSSALYILGGTSSNAAYNGLQKFDYSAGSWSSLTPTDTVLKNRKGMSASYIAATNSFITYGGRTDGTYGVASETFSIKASEPYTVTSATNPFSYTLQTPIMVDWTSGEVLMAGGSTTNLDVIIYNAGTNTWRESGATLADPVAKITNKGYLQTGDDGSKSLYTFDLSQNPVRVTRSVIVDATGAFVSKSATIVAARALAARALDASNWPTYNSSFAPSGVSSDVYSAAASSDGQIFFVTSDTSNPISAFSATKNSWVDVDSTLGTQGVLASEVSSTSASSSATATSSSASSSDTTASTTWGNTSASVTSSVTSSISQSSAFASATADAKAAAAASSSAAAAAATAVATASVDPHLAATNKNGLTKTEVAGAIMGSVLGFALLMLCVLLYTRNARRRKGYTGEENRKNQHYPTDEKNVGMSNEEFIDSLGGPPGSKPKRQNTVSMQSTSSIGIFGGKSVPAATAAPVAARAVSPSSSAGSHKNRRQNSDASIDAFTRDFKNTISKPIINDASALSPGSSSNGRVSINTPGRAPPKPPGSHIEPPPPPPPPVDDARRSSGWNKYWSQNSGALNIMGYGNNKQPAVDDDGSNYDGSTYSQNVNRMTQDSATVPPLIMPREGRPELNRVATGSPTVSHYNKYIPAQPQVATLERPMSDAPSAYSSGVPPSVADAWGESSVYGQPGQQQKQQPPGLAMGGPPGDMSWLNLGEYKRAQ